jgi:uncharacterized membrane protein YccC
MLRSYLKHHITGLHYAVRIFIGASLLWILLRDGRSSDSLWAIISLIVVTEPQIKPAWIAFRARMLNTVIGCAIGLFFLALPVSLVWILTPAIGISALVATYVNKVQQGWRIAPITTALIMSSAMIQPSTFGAFSLALHRTVEVFLGSLMALMVTNLMTYIWPSGDN